MYNKNENPVQLDSNIVGDGGYTNNYNTELTNCNSFNYQSNSQVAVSIKERKENVVTGTIGALLGSLIGVALWVLIAKLGFISAIAGLVMTFCSLLGYMKLGGGLIKKGVIICIIINIIMVYMATRLSWSLIIYDEFKDREFRVSFINIFKNLHKIIKLTDTKFHFYKDLVIGYLLTLVAGTSTFIKVIVRS